MWTVRQHKIFFCLVFIFSHPLLLYDVPKAGPLCILAFHIYVFTVCTNNNLSSYNFFFFEFRWLYVSTSDTIMVSLFFFNFFLLCVGLLLFVLLLLLLVFAQYLTSGPNLYIFFRCMPTRTTYSRLCFIARPHIACANVEMRYYFGARVLVRPEHNANANNMKTSFITQSTQRTLNESTYTSGSNGKKKEFTSFVVLHSVFF